MVDNFAQADYWFEEKMLKVLEYGGEGSEYEWINCIPEGLCTAINTEDRLKNQDVIDLFEGGIYFGEYIAKNKLKNYMFWHGYTGFYFLAKNMIELKKMINKAINDWKAKTEPLPPPLPKVEKLNIGELEALIKVADSAKDDDYINSAIFKLDNMIKAMVRK
ncbi:hypothetical protein KAR91_05950 [Candidatus Pacearchaeota archaeon]|nr:hypothetical protein [Candidatus Pacearchaeota archaeon]